MKRLIVLCLLSVLFAWHCNSPKGEVADRPADSVSVPEPQTLPVLPGAEQTQEYLPLLIGKRVALTANHTATIGPVHLADYLLASDINLVRVFAPEHGFRGTVERGKNFASGKDSLTGLEVVSLMGKNKEPLPEQLRDVEVMLFDIQDVGARFYTYISTMHYVMQACAKAGIPIIVLDRPNPNGDLIDGPVLQPAFQSFVGMHPIPVVHGCTVGELARMINGEGWLEGGAKCKLTVIPVANYSHTMRYDLPVRPSPNLPNAVSVRLYPSLCFFEATPVSVGRGTEFPFQVLGYPDKSFGDFSFTPVDRPGIQSNPLHEGLVCYGEDLRQSSYDEGFTLRYVIDWYKKLSPHTGFFSRAHWFDLLAGTDLLRRQITEGLSEEEIRLSWKSDLETYRAMRASYLLYPE